MVDPYVKLGKEPPRCGRPQAKVPTAIRAADDVHDKAPARLSGVESSGCTRGMDEADITGTMPALEELQNINARLLEAVESKSGQA